MVVAIEGDLTVRLDWDGRRVRKATVRSTRPFAAARVLVGRAPDDAARVLPRLFSICAHAQGAAAAGAIEAATGRVAQPQMQVAREAAVRLEAIQEYLWRVLLDWPQAMGRDGEGEPVAAARRLIAPTLARAAALAQDSAGRTPATAVVLPDDVANGLARLVARHVYGVPPAAWLAQDRATALDAWTAHAPTLPARLLGELCAKLPELCRSDVAPMPTPQRDALASTIVPAMRSTPGFERAPHWQGAPAETGALARTLGHPLVAAAHARYGNAVPARMVARLTELAMLIDRLAGAATEGAAPAWVDAFAVDDGEGLAAVQTARGLLLHRAQVADGRVTAYQIVAPTEWNFHPAGALVRGLEGAEAPDRTDLASTARLAVQALDPCVACRVEIADA